MATNPYVNKVVFGETTVIDISPTTAVESDVAQGKIFYKASGAQAVGTNSGGSSDGAVTQDQDGYLVLSDEPGTNIDVEPLSVTTNGTYTAPTGTAYSPVTVNVSGGGGGLEYEEGTWTPTADIARATISFQKTHSGMPIHVILSDISSKDTLIADSCTFWCYDDAYLISGYPFPLNASSAVQCYSISQWVYSSSSSYGAGRIYCTYPSSSTSDSSNSFPRYWVTETGFHPYPNSASRYFRSGRSYKWIAIWAPTT